MGNPQIESLRSADVDGMMRAFGDDPAEATPEERATAVYVWGAIREAIRPGRDGWLDDELAALRPWGFELADIRQPIAVWHDGDDSLVAIEHGRRPAAAILERGAVPRRRG